MREKLFKYLVLTQLLYDFVESKDLTPIDVIADFVVVNTYPRKEFKDKSITFEEAGLFPNATVVIEEAFEDDE